MSESWRDPCSICCRPFTLLAKSFASSRIENIAWWSSHSGEPCVISLVVSVASLVDFRIVWFMASTAANLRCANTSLRTTSSACSLAVTRADSFITSDRGAICLSLASISPGCAASYFFHSEDDISGSPAAR